MRIDVRKTAKLFIGGAFVRSESGRSSRVTDGGQPTNVARASRKDVRDAVRAARAGQSIWSAKTAYNRGQILYRLAEMMEARRGDFGVSPREFSGAVDRVVWYAGWCDKFEQFLSTKNPVAGPHHCVSAPEPTGVVAVIAPERSPLLGLVSTIVPPLAAGNAVVAVVAPAWPNALLAFAESVATCDLPAGALNLLTGDRAELAQILARHMDVNALSIWDRDEALLRDVTILGAGNVKRIDAHREPSPTAWQRAQTRSPQRIAAFVEIKTVWHPAGV
ncbi:MAG TPA: aldehyde dehydrogenase family protein [Candidatus Eremiobacteraceae bacterium]|nr:aldehyde dehydrogenase family protein [Candidatus Eremiobacteraceae bacterium]